EGEPLRHVARARREHAARELRVARLQHRVAGPADLERAHRLQQLQLQPDLRVRVHVEADERRADRNAVQHLARQADLLDRDHSDTTVPAASASARASTYSAAARSSTARPSDLKTVISSSERRPSAVPATRSPSSARMCSGPIAPSRWAKRKSPDSFSVDSRRSTKSAAAAIVAVSSSRVVGTLEPTALTCTPGFSHSRRTTGSASAVTVQRTSASRTASSALPTLSAPSSVLPLALHTSTRSKPRTACIASRCERACVPVPRIASVPTSARASRRVATADTAAVRTAVIPPAFTIARGSPVSPSNSATNPWCES